MNDPTIVDIPKAYITKYALTSGVFVIKGKWFKDSETRMLNTLRGWYHGDEWHTDRESAVRKCEKMKQAKIASLKKQINKIEAINFEILETLESNR